MIRISTDDTKPVSIKRRKYKVVLEIDDVYEEGRNVHCYLYRAHPIKTIEKKYYSDSSPTFSYSHTFQGENFKNLDTLNMGEVIGHFTEKAKLQLEQYEQSKKTAALLQKKLNSI